MAYNCGVRLPVAMHEEIVKTIEQIRAENNPTEVVILIKKLRRLLAAEQNRIEALLAKNKAAQLRNAKDHPAPLNQLTPHQKLEIRHTKPRRSDDIR